MGNLSYAQLCFVLACMTDALDGYLARRYKCQTNLGAFLDSCADKILLFVCLALLLSQKILHTQSQFVLTFIIFLRECLILALRLYTSAQGVTLVGSNLCKLKTGMQFLCIATYLTANVQPNSSMDILSYLLLCIACILSIVTCFEYRIVKISK